MRKISFSLVVLAIVAAGCSRVAEDTGAGASAGEAPAAKSQELSKSVPKGWMEDFAAAKEKAAKENKKILMAFSGSDWCHWCVKMDRDVYSQSDFVSKASRDYVLVMIDNPQNRGILSPLAASQNDALTGKYGIQGFPSTLVVDAKGEVVKRISGYKPSPEAMLKALAE